MARSSPVFLRCTLLCILLRSFQCVVSVELIVSSEPWVDKSQDATLTCSSSAGFRDVNWRKGIEFNSSSAILFYDATNSAPVWDDSVDKSHYAFDATSDSYPLTIKSVTLDDEDRYWCKVTDYVSFANVRNSSIITVRVPPTTLTITYGDGTYSAGSISVVAGNNSQFTCNAPDIKPAAVFSWATTTLQPSEPAQIDTPSTSDNRLVNSTNTITVDIPETPAQHQLSCGATNRQDGKTENEVEISVTLQVKVPPKESAMSLTSTGTIVPGGQVSVTQGIAHTFTCLVQGTRPAVTIKWFLNDVLQATIDPTPGGDSDDLIETSSDWSYTPLRSNHLQTVKCEASTTETTLPAPSVMLVLQVNGPPDTPVISSNSPTMTENVPTTLTCRADLGYPDSWSLVWFKGTDTITGSAASAVDFNNRYNFTSTSDELTPVREDNGKTSIKCIAQWDSWNSANPEGSLILNVQFCARSVSVTNCPTVTVGSTALLTCVSESSNPATTLTWSRDDVGQTGTTPQPDSDGSNGGFITTLDMTTNVLTKDDNGAVFQCSGSNDVVMCGGDGVDFTDSCALNVQYTPEFTEPTVNPETPVIEGGEVILTCTADANPKPLDFIVWEKLDSSSTLPSTVHSDGISTLTLSNIQRDQAGSYRCKANNEIPTSNSDVFSEPVIVKVNYEVGITNKNENEIGVKDDKDAFLLCKAVGNPMPVMTWYDPNNTVITSTRNPDKYTVEDTTTSGDDIYGFMVTSNLTIKRVDSQVDYGVYTCNSSNGIGQVDMLTVLLNGTRRPNKPSNVSLAEQTSSSIAVRWTAGYDGGETQWFHVGYKKTADSSETVSDKIDGGVTAYNVDGLESYTEYEIRVYAENEVDRNPNPGSIVTYTLPVSVAKAGITIEFNVDEGTLTVSGLKDGGGCIQLEVKYEGNSSNWVECGECITADSKVLLADWCPQTQKRSRRAVGNVDDVQAKYCQGSENDKLCSGSDRAERVFLLPAVMNPQGSSSGGIIAGGLVGGIFLVVIIIILIWYLRKTSPSDPKSSHTDTSSIELATDNFGRNGQVNEGLQGSDGEPLREKYTRTSGYISLPEPVDDEPETPTTTWSVDQATKTDESLHMTPAPRPMSTTGEGGAERSAKPAAVERMVTDTGDTYALVNKEKPKDKSPPPNLPDVTYADVNKKAQAKRPKKYVPPSKADQESEYEDVRLPPQNMKSKIGAGASGYEVVNLDSPKTSTADEENDYADVSQHQSPSGRTVNEDGLIYMEVGHYKKHPVNQPPIQTEESTTYASIDFKRLVAPDVAK